MFLITKIEDLVRIAPSEFTKDANTAITDSLNRKYSNKVLHNVGLCIRVFRILSTTDFVVHACQDGSYQSKGA
jgi:DNA-directed RNA polymerase III subunit RPC8